MIWYYLVHVNRCIRVCHSWRVFIGRHLVCGADHELRSRLVRRKLPLDWLGLSGSPGPKVTRIPITKTLAPPLRIEADERDVVMSTVDSLLVWDRTTKRFKGEIGPEIDGIYNNNNSNSTSNQQHCVFLLTTMYTVHT